ncbi:helix-turn-helix domain-containing protein [Halobacteria archaeon AArc-dxtr1]|nr:helix-turn-helix domain-containing protein [Halobacteria archaeon AArc-dxtr1]
MVEATLRITLPESMWITQLSRAHSETTFRILAAVPGPEFGFVVSRITGPDVPTVVEAMDAHDQLRELHVVTEHHSDEATVHFETNAPLVLFSPDASELPIRLPARVEDGEAELDVVGSRDQLAALADRLERVGIQYRIEHAREPIYDRHRLSDRQLDIVITAVEQGYYDTPRQCTLTELADHLDIAKSTCSETLHRAEEAVVKQFVEGRSST